MYWFTQHESAPSGQIFELNTVLHALKFNPDGLLPCIAQQKDDGQVLMLAWMNREAIDKTLTEGFVHYWSRSRQRLWKKGERSGQVQRLVELRVDCDGDALLAVVKQQGPACHTGRPNCFFYSIQPDQHHVLVNAEPVIAPEQLYKTVDAYRDT